MTKKQRIEVLEKEVKRLNFIVKNGGENKTAVKKECRCWTDSSLFRMSFIDQYTGDVKSVDTIVHGLKARATIYKDTDIEAIIKIKNANYVEWFKLDKKQCLIVSIPEPAEFAEMTVYVKDELTKDDKLEPSDKTVEELLVKKTLEPAADPVHTCANCKHLKVINDNDIYAVCKRTHFVFEPFEIDTRAHKCRWGEFKTVEYHDDECCGDTEGKDEVKSDDQTTGD